MSRLVVCLQFYSADRASAMRLARLIADIELSRREDVEIIFVARFDTDHDHETIKYVEQKFPVSWFTTHTWWTGWPAGPNAMAKDTLEWVAANRKNALGVLLLEPDCVPVKTNWLDILIDEWRIAKAADVWIMGAWRASGGEFGHLNGNCIVRPDFGWLAGAEQINQHTAWDCVLNGPRVREHWFVTERIHNCFQSVDAKMDELFPLGIEHQPRALVHGYKDDSLVKLIWPSYDHAYV